MPFMPQSPRPFTVADVQSLWPGLCGCYGLFNNFVGCVYVGSGGDVRERLLAHLRGDNPLITMYGPTYFVLEYTLDYVSREKWLIAEYRPPANQRVG